MVKDTKTLKTFEDDLIRREGILSYSHAIGIFESMWNEGVSLGTIPASDPLEGIDTDIKIAEILNSCFRKYSPD